MIAHCYPNWSRMKWFCFEKWWSYWLPLLSELKIEDQKIVFKSAIATGHPFWYKIVATSSAPSMICQFLPKWRAISWQAPLRHQTEVRLSFHELVASEPNWPFLAKKYTQYTWNKVKQFKASPITHVCCQEKYGVRFLFQYKLASMLAGERAAIKNTIQIKPEGGQAP